MSQYWQNRFQILEDKRNKRAKETIKSVTPAFDQAQAQTETEVPIVEYYADETEAKARAYEILMGE